MSLGRHFLTWDRPLLPQAVEFLATEWSGSGPLNLAETLVVVPTRQSGRRLREALAAHAAARNAAVFPPRVMLPESLVAAGAEKLEIATRLESQLAWIEVFRGLELDDFRAVFPIDPPARNFAWARRLAQEFSRLQATLAESGLKLADVIEKTGEEFPEGERWGQIAQLEALHAEKLSALGRRDPQAAKLERAQAPVLPEGIKRIVVIGTPDPLPLAVAMLAAHARTLPVDIVIFAEDSEASAFDEWGRARVASWETRILDLPRFEQHVRLCSDPTAQAERVGELAVSYGEPEGMLAVGAADAEIIPLLENVLSHAGFQTFNPEGRTRASDGLYALLSALAGLARDDAFATVAAIGRCPDFLSFLDGRIRNFSAATFLKRLDRLHTRHLPPDLTEARRHDQEGPELFAIAELRAVLVQGQFPANAAAALAMIFEARKFRLNIPAEAAAEAAAKTWTEVMRETAAVVAEFPDVSNDEWWELALGLFGESVSYDEKPAGAVELQGWLELLWEDAPHLVVAGLNDGRVPDAIVGDPFLPESLRGLLGMKTNGQRFARDAYLLQALVKCRQRSGSVELLLGKTSAVGDPLRPSRLLLRCADSELAARVAFLFSPADAARSNPPWRRAWQLSPPHVASPDRVAVTALRDWLACPFRFYLKRVLRMEAVDPAKSELDPMDFGTLCHAALEAMGREPALRDCTDAAVIRKFLLGALDRKAAAVFGAAHTLPLLVQLESARQRLSRAAEIQARERAEGWVIVQVEHGFSIEVGNLTVTGKIDRVDRHETTGAVRVLDYKTSDKPVAPRAAHIRNRRLDEALPEFVLVAGDDREAWCDLQLPIYLRALAAEFPGSITGGYFNLPKASTETGIALWEDYTLTLAESAWEAANGVAAAIRAGDFWPPNENIREEQDEFAALFHHGAEASVAWKEGGA